MNTTLHPLTGTGKTLDFTIEGYNPQKQAEVFYSCKIIKNTAGEIEFELTKILRQNSKDVVVVKILFNYPLPSLTRPFIDEEIYQIIEMSVNDIDKQICDAVNGQLPNSIEHPFSMTPITNELVQELVRVGKS